jgi:hypothetical protein
MTTRRAVAAAAISAGTLIAMAGPAFADHCTNASRNANNPTAGAQVILGDNGEIISATNGVVNRIDQGLIDPNTGEGFHGIISFGGVASTYIGVGPTGDALPDQAINNGPACKGITDLGTYFTECVPAG